ncbi:hypothetical protein UN64_19555 [Fictibacillus arsenicus]|uniref:Uncharacterized protein n=1 Tax=Fictibacillus arsenicus TaxID=255247 RepID=A0A1V3FZH9_9BACL|nr:hypothetical protein UN64_19555 [Fictibacillus arsenicus]
MDSLVDVVAGVVGLLPAGGAVCAPLGAELVDLGCGLLVAEVVVELVPVGGLVEEAGVDEFVTGSGAEHVHVDGEEVPVVAFVVGEGDQGDVEAECLVG